MYIYIYIYICIHRSLSLYYIYIYIYPQEAAQGRECLTGWPSKHIQTYKHPTYNKEAIQQASNSKTKKQVSDRLARCGRLHTRGAAPSWHRQLVGHPFQDSVLDLEKDVKSCSVEQIIATSKTQQTNK